MTDFKNIIEDALSNFTECDPADPNDPTAWHMTDKEIRGLCNLVAERVEEEMLDPVKVGEIVAKLPIERDAALTRCGKLEKENLRLVVEMDELLQTIHDQAEIIERLEARQMTTEVTPQRKAQLELLCAIGRHDAVHLIDTIEDIGPNRWVSLRCSGNERIADIRIEGDGRLTGFHSKKGCIQTAEVSRGQWTPHELLGAAIAWMEVGIGGPSDE